MLHGVDLSHWQGEVDFSLLKGAGIEFAFLKFTEGTTHVDSRCAEYLRDANAAGIPAGPYHYFLPKYDPLEQADHFLATLREREAREGALLLPPVLDVEVKASSAVLRSRILAFLEHVEQERGVTPIIYTSPGFWRSYVGRWDACIRFPLWVAHYGTSYPSQFHPWVRWLFWQFTRAGRVPGIAANVDLNIFPGTLRELRELCTVPPVEDPIYDAAYQRAQRKSITDKP